MEYIMTHSKTDNRAWLASRTCLGGRLRVRPIGCSCHSGNVYWRAHHVSHFNIVSVLTKRIKQRCLHIDCTMLAWFVIFSWSIHSIVNQHGHSFGFIECFGNKRQQYDAKYWLGPCFIKATTGMHQHERHGKPEYSFLKHVWCSNSMFFPTPVFFNHRDWKCQIIIQTKLNTQMFQMKAAQGTPTMTHMQ